MKTLTRGFSILEILITVVILGIGILAVSKFQGTTIQNTSNSAQRAEATNLAKQELETLRKDVIDGNLDLSSGSASSAKTKTSATATFDIKTNVTKNTTLDNGYDTSVVVTWPDITVQPGTSPSADTTVVVASVVSNTPSITDVASDSLPPPTDPTVDLVVCTCSGTSMATDGFRHMSSSAKRNNKYFVKTGMGHHRWTTTQQSTICDTCCALPTMTNYSGGMSGGMSSTYICGVRNNKCEQRWSW